MLRTFGKLRHYISQHDPTMLQDVALKFCVRLAGPLQKERNQTEAECVIPFTKTNAGTWPPTLSNIRHEIVNYHTD